MASVRIALHIRIKKVRITKELEQLVALTIVEICIELIWMDPVKDALSI